MQALLRDTGTRPPEVVPLLLLPTPCLSAAARLVIFAAEAVQPDKLPVDP